MTDYVESGVKLIADTDDYTSKVEDAISLAESIDDLSPTLTVDAEVGDMSAVDDITNLDGAQINTKIDTKEGGETIGGKSLLTTLHELGVNPMEIIMNVGGTILDLVSSLNSFAVQPMLDIDDAVAHFNAETNNAIPNARELFHDILFDDLGESVDQIGAVATKAAQIKAPVEEATRAALTFTHTFSDEDPTAVLDTLNQMVINGLAPNFQAASDIITVGFQNGANRSGDLLSAVKDNATAFKDLGFDGPQAMSAITSGLDAGFNSANQVAQALEKMKINITSAAGNNTADASKTLDFLGLPNPAETGQEWSAEYVQSVIDSIKNAPVSDADKIAMVESLVGTKLGAKEASSLLGLDVLDSPDLFKNVENRAAQAAASADNSLRGAINDFMLVAQNAATDFLSSEQIDLPGKIEALKTGLQDALSVLQEGGSLGDALTVGLKPIGFDDEFQKLENIFGVFIIELLGVIASIQETFGGTAGIEAAAGTRAEQARLAKRQLAFQLKIDNPDELAQDFTTALKHGVDPAELGSALSDAVDSLLSEGATERAQALLDAVETNASGMKIQLDPSVDAGSRASISEWLTNNGLGKLNADGSIDLAFTPGMTPDARQKMISDVKNGLTYDKYTVTPTISDETKAELQQQIQDAIDETAIEMPVVGDKTATLGGHTLGLGAGGGGDLPTTLEKLAESMTSATQPATDASEATADLTTKVEAHSVAAGNTATSVNDLTYQMGQSNLAAAMFGGGVQKVDGYMGEASLTTTETGLALQGAALQMSILSDRTHDFTVNAAAAVASMSGAAAAAKGAAEGGSAGTTPSSGPQSLQSMGMSNRVVRAMMQAMTGVPFIANGGSTSRVQNLNITNQVQNNAQANNISYEIGAQVRGF